MFSNQFAVDKILHYGKRSFQHFRFGPKPIEMLNFMNWIGGRGIFH